MELGAEGPDWGKPGRLGGRTKQTEAAWAKGTVPLRYFICVCLFLFFSLLMGERETGWKGDRKTKSKRRKKKNQTSHDSSHPLPSLAPGLSQ